jgi:hypothetical protein
MISESSHSFEFLGYGTVFRLQGTDAAPLEQAACRARALGWTRTTSCRADVTYLLRRARSDGGREPAQSYELHCDRSLVRITPDLEEILEAFEDHAKLETALRAEGCLFVHAGAISWNGHGIILPARSRAGKTTLVRTLVAAGAEYYSDEFAVLDGDGFLHPYAVPLSIRVTGTAQRLKTPIELIGGRAGVRPVPVDLIVVTDYRARARWRPRVLSSGNALLALMENTVAARQPPARSMPILRQAVLGARAIQTPRGDAPRVATALLAEIGN